MTTAKEQIRVWISPETKAFLEQRAEESHRALSEIACQMLEERAIEIKAGEISPWLADMLDAVLSRYFQGFPETLQRLVLASYEAHSWQSSSFVKLLEICGDKDVASQNRRVAKASGNIAEFADRKAAEFFQALAAPEELIEPDEPAAE